ncbi:MAG: hypothetical protein EAZ76_12080 [Nostocales cyanobacterium]|nr:MAG: hypothetical protein EAZ87_03310 [Nostocales cyanobacterium]TAF13296.1 MAG: hypothetical protein EAZ76_12080 [Nostocales cyanobacterium]
MIRKFLLFSIVILVISSLLFLDNLESRAESIIYKDKLELQNSQTQSRVSDSNNHTNPRSKINSGLQNNNFPDTKQSIKQYDTLIVGDGFIKGKFVGHVVGTKIRKYACDQFDLECNTRSYIENE